MFAKRSFGKNYVVDLLAFNNIVERPGLNIQTAGYTYFSVPQIRGFKTYTLILAVNETDVITGIQIGLKHATLDITAPTGYATDYPLKTITDLDFKLNPFYVSGLGLDVKDFTISCGGNALDYTGHILDNIMPYINNVKVDNFFVQKFILLCRN